MRNLASDCSVSSLGMCLFVLCLIVPFSRLLCPLFRFKIKSDDDLLLSLQLKLCFVSLPPQPYGQPGVFCFHCFCLCLLSQVMKIFFVMHTVAHNILVRQKRKFWNNKRLIPVFWGYDFKLLKLGADFHRDVFLCESYKSSVQLLETNSYRTQVGMLPLL